MKQNFKFKFLTPGKSELCSTQFYHRSYTLSFVLAQRTSKSDYLSALIVQTSLITLETPPVFVKYHKKQVALHCTAFIAQ